MALPDFTSANGLSAPDLRVQIADRVRLERRKLRLSQRKFADQCRIPLRTYKRFEQGSCDSLEAFLRIVCVFERIAALELLFPPKAFAIAENRSPTAALDRLLKRAEGEGGKR